ncbi:MAG: tetratricopeptide repeat protein [Acidobacteria bacterium]|nr:tetratricopeptide repeat protein [Acidobacteriota bacterium]MBI3656302.1 tetratricopeptide repeat protein [Acidobacteriota bacterium]
MKAKIFLIFIFLLPAGFMVERTRKAVASAPFQQGEASLRQGDFKSAIADFEKAIAKNDNAGRARQGLLLAYMETGRYEEAIRAAEGFPATEAANPWLSAYRGDAERRLGRYAEAEISFKRSLELAQGQMAGRDSQAVMDARLRLADLYAFRGRAQEADAQSREVVTRLSGQEGPRTAAEYLALGRSLRRLALYHEANETLRAAVAADPESAAAFIERGRLFLEKYDHPYAAELFQQALKINRHATGALIGLAESKRVDNGAEAAELCRRALAINPRLEEAQNLLATLLIEAEDYTEALVEIEKVLQWNPHALETRALRAVCYYFLNQPKNFNAETEKVRAINSQYGRLYHLLAEFSGYRARYAQAVEFSRQAIARSPDLWSSYAALGINLLRLGDARGGRENLAMAFAKDPFDVRAKNTLDLLDTVSQYHEFTTEHFRVQLHQREAAVLQPYVADLLEKAYRALALRFRFQPPAPIFVEMYPNHADFAVRTFGLPGIAASGACFGKVVVMDSPSAKDLKDFNWGSTLWHELTHVFTLQSTENRLPRWFSEGLSVFEEQRAHEGWGTSFKKAFLKAFAQKSLLKLKDLNRGFVRPQTPEQVPASYHQAGLICDYIDRRYGFDRILGLLEQYRNQVPTDQAFKNILGVSLEEFDADFFKYVDTLKLVPPEKATEDPEELIRTSEANFEAHLKLAEVQVKQGGAPAIRRAIDLLSAALYINPFEQKVHETLAGLFMQQNQVDEAIREYRVIVALTPVDMAKAHYDLAHALHVRGNKKEARIEVLKALEIAPKFESAQELLLNLTP